MTLEAEILENEEANLPGEEEVDDDTDTNLSVWEDLREELSAASRELLGLPKPRSNVVDTEVDTVLTYLYVCAGYFTIDMSADYEHSTALTDLELLSQAIGVVRDKILSAQRAGKTVGSLKKSKEDEGVEVIETSAIPLPELPKSDEESWEEWFNSTMSETPPSTGRVEAITIGGEED